MKRFISRLTKVILVVTIPFFILTLIELLTEITGGKIGDYLQNNHGISTRAMVITLFVLMAFSLAIQIRDKWSSSNQKFDSANSINQQGTGNIAVQDVSGTVTINNYVSSERKPQESGIEADLRILYDSLRERYRKRYENKLDGRFEITLEVNEDWRFDKPATYKFSAEAKISEAATAVRNAFDEKGRLLIVGNAGSGKTVLLLNLARQLLGDGYEKDQQIPVIFNLASWRETYKNFEDWLIEVLNTGNGLSKDFAKTVLREKKIIFLLDGLDELARNEEPQTADEIRAKCMESLNDYLREGRRTVICCRREEFTAMQKTTAKDAPVSAKVEVLDLTKADIILALQQAKNHNESRAAAENLEKLIETNGIFLEVLRTPFYFTTALEVFDKHHLKKNSFPTDINEIKIFLLSEFVSNKYKYSENLKEYEVDFNKIENWLKWLADLLERKQIITFEISTIEINDLTNKTLPRVILGTLNGIYFGFFSQFILQDLISYPILLLVGVLVGCVIGFIVGKYFVKFFENFITTNDIQTLVISNIFNLSKWKAAIRQSIFVSLFIGVFVGIIGGTVILYFWGFLFGILASILFGIGGGIFAGSIFCFFDTITEVKYFTVLDSPYKRLKAGFLLDTFKWTLLVCIGNLILSFLLQGTLELLLNGKIFFDLIISPYFISISILFGIISGCFASPLFRHLILRFSLWIERAIPLKYTIFLNYAAEAGILEEEGGQWRFRHQNLQEYFAGLETEK